MKHSYSESARITAILEQAGAIDGIDGMRQSQDATASLPLRSGREVLFTYRSSAASLFAYMRMFRLPTDTEQRLAVMQGLLMTNFLRRGTSEGEFAIDTDGVTVIFQIALSPASLSVSKLDRIIDTLAHLDFSVEDFLCIGSRSSAQSRSTQTFGSNSTRARLLRSHAA